MNFAEYAAIDAMNWSRLKKGAASMLHLKHAIDSTDDGDTTSRLLLRAVHSAVLEPDTFDEDYVVFDGAVRRGKEWEAFKAAHAGRTILNRTEQAIRIAEKERIVQVAAAVRRHSVAHKLIASASCEHTIVWTDRETGVRCKARMDAYAPKRHIADLKGDRSVDEYLFTRRVGSMLYHGQAAWYQMGVEALTGDRLPYYLIPYETAAPHDVAVFEVDEDWLKPGRELCHRLLRQYAEAKRADVWPGRYDGIRPLLTPPKHINPDVEDYEVFEDN